MICKQLSAYGRPHDSSKEQILERLLALDLERAAEVLSPSDSN